MSQQLDNYNKLKIAQEDAPSYIHIEPDGAPMKCDICGKRDNGMFVKTFTPNRVNHPAAHLACIDAEWIEIAKNMGFTI